MRRKSEEAGGKWPKSLATEDRGPEHRGGHFRRFCHKNEKGKNERTDPFKDELGMKKVLCGFVFAFGWVVSMVLSILGVALYFSSWANHRMPDSEHLLLVEASAGSYVLITLTTAVQLSLIRLKVSSITGRPFLTRLVVAAVSPMMGFVALVFTGTLLLKANSFAGQAKYLDSIQAVAGWPTCFYFCIVLGFDLFLHRNSKIQI